MTEAPQKRGKLFFKFLVVFLIVSLVPLGIVGSYLVNLSQVTLNRAISRDQEALAVGFADTVASYIINFRNVLFDALRRRPEATVHVDELELAAVEDDGVDCWCVLAQARRLKPEYATILEGVPFNVSGTYTINVTIYNGDNQGTTLPYCSHLGTSATATFRYESTFVRATMTGTPHAMNSRILVLNASFPNPSARFGTTPASAADISRGTSVSGTLAAILTCASSPRAPT